MEPKSALVLRLVVPSVALTVSLLVWCFQARALHQKAESIFAGRSLPTSCRPTTPGSKVPKRSQRTATSTAGGPISSVPDPDKCGVRPISRSWLVILQIGPQQARLGNWSGPAPEPSVETMCGQLYELWHTAAGEGSKGCKQSTPSHWIRLRTWELWRVGSSRPPEKCNNSNDQFAAGVTNKQRRTRTTRQERDEFLIRPGGTDEVLKRNYWRAAPEFVIAHSPVQKLNGVWVVANSSLRGGSKRAEATGPISARNCERSIKGNSHVFLARS